MPEAATPPETLSTPRVRVLLIAPPLSVVGGHSIQAAHLLEGLRAEAEIEISFLPAALPAPIGFLRHVPLARTAVMTACFQVRLLWRLPKVDVVHVFTAAHFSFLWAPAPTLVWAKLFGRKTLLNYHDGRAEQHLSRWPIAKPLISLADRVVVPSGYLREVFARHGVAARVVANLIDAGAFRFRRRERPSPAFLHNRGLEPLYNAACSLRAFAIVQRRYEEASMVVAHDGPCRKELEQLAAELRLRNVRFVGAVSRERMVELHEEADIYWMSPNIDNMPLSALECFASGLPVVSTRAGGVPFVIEDGENGLLVDLDDDQALAAAAIRLLEEPGLAARLAENARAELDKYTWSAVRDDWVGLYFELAGVAT